MLSIETQEEKTKRLFLPGLPRFTGGHIDLAIPGLGLVGFYGDTRQATSSSGAMNSPGYFLHTYEEWIVPKDAKDKPGGRPEYVTPNKKNELPKAYICEMKICPKMIDAIIAKFYELKSNPPEFKFAGGNCSTRATQLLQAGGVLTGSIFDSGIHGIDNPYSLQLQLEKEGARCFYGTTVFAGPNKIPYVGEICSGPCKSPYICHTMEGEKPLQLEVYGIPVGDGW